MSCRGIVVWALGACIGVSGAVAQDAGGRARGQDRRDEAFKMVDAYVIANIQESLSLDDDSYVKVIPVVNRLQKERRDFFQERARAQRQMRRLLRSGTATEAEIRELLVAYKTLEVDGPRRIQKHMDELDALLTPIQQAKYRVFELEVEHRMRDLMRRGRRDQPQGDRPGQ